MTTISEVCGHYKQKRFCPSQSGHYIRMATLSEVYCTSILQNVMTNTA